MWYSNTTNQDGKALQRVVRLAERISGSALPSLQHIYLKRCRSRAVKIIKDSTHPVNHLFCLLPSGKRFRPSGSLTQTQSHKHLQDSLLTVKHSLFPSSVLLLCVHTQYQPVCTSLPSLLFIVLFIKSHILFLHILLVLHFSLFYCTFYSLFLFFTYIYALVLCYFYIICILCTVH